MSQLSVGVCGSSRKENEFRLPIHPRHFEAIPLELRQSMFLEDGYGRRFGTKPEQLTGLFAGVRTQSQLFEECDVILLPKPLAEDLDEMHEGQILWGWPHCVQDERLTQSAIDRKLTLIAWEAMNVWHSDGSFNLHVFQKSNELAGYCSVLHALQMLGLTGQYGRQLRAAVISFGSTARGAVTALAALGIPDVTILSHRDPAQVASPVSSATILQFESEANGSSRLNVITDEGSRPMVDVLSEHDIVVNCVLQDPDTPQVFVVNDDLDRFAPGGLFIDVSCDEGMGFEWARPTAFSDPMFTVGDVVHYYAVDHSPSYLWNSATWQISEAVLSYLPTVIAGPQAWDADDTVRRAIEIRNGVVQNPKIVPFQRRSPDYPHVRLTSPTQ
ncbi:MAG: N(5)-(carboxyethyl)ornithine synthase [Actinomycetota bacterium]|nr:N(5)-(carboxyethyl)ornithine synthase [Actinomycetota bacterium]